MHMIMMRSRTDADVDRDVAPFIQFFDTTSRLTCSIEPVGTHSRMHMHDNYSLHMHVIGIKILSQPLSFTSSVEPINLVPRPVLNFAVRMRACVLFVGKISMRKVGGCTRALSLVTALQV